MATSQRGRANRGLAVWAAPCIAALVGLAALGAAALGAQSPSLTTSLTTGTLVGLVVGASGHPEPGAVVEVQSENLRLPPRDAVTNGQGVVSFTNLVVGAYVVRAGKGDRIAERQQRDVHARISTLVLFNLPQLSRTAQLAASPQDQQFRWTVRQAAALRPALRFDDSGPGQNASSDGPALSGSVSVIAGGDPATAGNNQINTRFDVATSVWDGTQVDLAGNAGSAAIGEGTDFAATFRPSPGSGSDARLRVGLQEIGMPSTAMPMLRILTVNYADTAKAGNFELLYGAQLNAVSLDESTHTFDPYLRAAWHWDRTRVEYRAALAAPPLDFSADSADMPAPMPRVSLVGGNGDRPAIEDAHHQEVRVEQSLSADDTVSAAAFTEHYTNTALYGVGADGALASTNGLLPALFGDMFTAAGANYGGDGYRIVYDHRFSAQWHAAFGLAEGIVLAPGTGALSGADLSQQLQTAHARAYTARLYGALPLTGADFVCSYRATSRSAVTGVDLYDDTADQSDPYLSLRVRQPLPQWLASGGSRVSALLDVRNLLAQGYVPLSGGDGSTLYLVPVARAISGGFSVSF